MSSLPEPLQLTPADEIEADEAMARLSSLAEELRGTVYDRTRTGIRLDLGLRGQRFVAPWKRTEQFFRQGSGIAPLEVDDPDLQRFMAHRAAGRLCYGYPCYIDANGHVLPLLFCDVRLRIASGGQIQVELDRNSRPQVNQRVLVGHGYDRSLTDDLIFDLITRDFEDFDACLTYAARLLGLEDGLFAADRLSPWPIDDRGEGWRNTPILFAPADDATQQAIADELLTVQSAIRTAPRHTALHAFFDAAPGAMDKPVPALAPFATGTGSDSALETCLDHTLSYLTASPGTGRLPFMANLIASQIAGGGSVLFVSSHGHVIDQVVGQLEGVLQRNGNWISRLEQRSAHQELLQSLEEAAKRQGNVVPALADTPPQESRKAEAGLAHLAEVEQRLEGLRNAHLRFSVARAEMAAVMARVARPWWPVFDPGAPLAIDREAAEALLERVKSIESDANRTGFQKLFGKPDGQRQFDETVRDVIAALGPLPEAVTRPLEGALADAAQDKQIPTLLSAAEALVASFPWRDAWERARDAEETIAKSPDAATLIRHMSAAQAVATKAERGFFSAAWSARIDRNLSAAAEKIGAFLSLQADRQQREAPDDWLDRKLVQAMGDTFAGVPFWTGRVENVLARLPLEPALFDLIVIEDAQSIDAGALLPLLFRARQAVVVATRAPIAHHRSTAAGLMGMTDGGTGVQLLECARGHAHITRALSLSCHAGQLRAVGNCGKLAASAGPAMAGIHWHPVNAEAGYVEDPQLDSVLALIERWRADGVFDQRPPKTIGIACPGPERRATLTGALGRLLGPSTFLERIAVAGPERFHSQVVDYLIAIPLQDGKSGSDRADRLASSALMYHDAIAAARLGVHLVGDRLRARSDGHLLGALAGWEAVTSAEGAFDAEVEDGIARLTPALDQAGLCHTRTPRGLTVFGPLGTVYELIVPGGRGSQEDAGADTDVVSIDLTEGDLAEPPTGLRTLLARLV